MYTALSGRADQSEPRHWHSQEALVAGYEYEVASRDVIGLVRDSDCSAYDCEFVALAQSLGVALVTADAKILKAFPRVAVPLNAG